jgi:hypothetical protein
VLSLNCQQVVADFAERFCNNVCVSLVKDMFACCVIERDKRALSVTLNIPLNVPVEHEILVAGE